MYQVADSQALARGGRALVRRKAGRAAIPVSGTVVLLGLTSMFTDISSEMVTAILPLYLIFTLGLSPLQFGVIDGIQQGAAALFACGMLTAWMTHRSTNASRSSSPRSTCSTTASAKVG